MLQAGDVFSPGARSTLKCIFTTNSHTIQQAPFRDIYYLNNNVIFFLHPLNYRTAAKFQISAPLGFLSRAAVPKWTRHPPCNSTMTLSVLDAARTGSMSPPQATPDGSDGLGTNPAHPWEKPEGLDALFPDQSPREQHVQPKNPK